MHTFFWSYCIEQTASAKPHFAQCNNARCQSIFLIYPGEDPGALGFLCPRCSAKTVSHHIIQCASCHTIINLVRASGAESKNVFPIDKCSHCYGTIEDEWAIEPIYQSDSYI